MQQQSLITLAVLGLAILRGPTVVGDEPKPKPYYFTTTVGDRLVFDVNSGGTRCQSVVEVTAAEWKDGVALVGTRTILGSGSPSP